MLTPSDTLEATVSVYVPLEVRVFASGDCNTSGESWAVYPDQHFDDGGDWTVDPTVRVSLAMANLTPPLTLMVSSALKFQRACLSTSPKNRMEVVTLGLSKGRMGNVSASTMISSKKTSPTAYHC